MRRAVVPEVRYPVVCWDDSVTSNDLDAMTCDVCIEVTRRVTLRSTPGLLADCAISTTTTMQRINFFCIISIKHTLQTLSSSYTA